MIIVYGQDAWHEEKFAPRLYTEIELDLMYRAWANDEPLEYCDGPWGKATTETGLGIIRSAAERNTHGPSGAVTGRPAPALTEIEPLVRLPF